MSGVKISAMAAAGALNGVDVFPIVQGGVNKQCAISILQALMASGDAATLQGYKAAYFLAAAAYTAADVLTKIKTVDGSGSGLDADLVQGRRSLDGRVTGSTGSTATGSGGFTSARTGTGVYTITYGAAFSAVPTVVATLRGNTGGSLIIVSNETVNGCTISTFSTPGTAYDLDFGFYAKGAN